MELKKKIEQKTEAVADATVFQIILALTVKLIKFTFKFAFYMCVMLLKLVIHYIAQLLDWVDETYFENWHFVAAKRKADREHLMEIEMLEDAQTFKHTYKMKRNEEYEETYDQLQQVLGAAIEYDRVVSIDKKTAQDIFLKIDRLTFQAERNAMEQAYLFALDSEGMYKNKDIYVSYMRETVLKNKQ